MGTVLTSVKGSDSEIEVAAPRNSKVSKSGEKGGRKDEADREGGGKKVNEHPAFSAHPRSLFTDMRHPRCLTK